MDTLVSENRVIMNFLDNFLSKFMFGVANRNVSFTQTKHKLRHKDILTDRIIVGMEEGGKASCFFYLMMNSQ